MFHAVGLGHILPGNTDASIAGAMPNMDAAVSSGMPAAARSKPNITPYKNRPYIPRNESPSGRSNPQTTAGIEPGTMSPQTLQSPEVQGLLGRFGVGSDVNVDPNLFMHNQQFNQVHPHLAGALEGALSGLAFTHGGDTVGDSLSNIASGMMNAHSAHAEHINSQLMAPFQQATAVANLQKEAGAIDEQKASMAHSKAMSDYYADMADHYKDQDDIKQQMLDQKKSYDDKLSQLKEDSQDPQKLAGHTYLTRAYKELTKQYGGEENIPASAYMKVMHGLNTEVYGTKALEHPAHPRASGLTANDRLTKEQLSVLQKQRSTLDKQYTNATKNPYIIDENGKMWVSGSKEHKQYVDNIRSQRDQVDQQLGNIVHLPTNANPVQAPSPVNPTGVIPKNPY